MKKKKKELQDLDRRTRKLLTINEGFHPRDCAARLYAPRKDGGRGLMSAEDYINQAKTSLACYVQSIEEVLLKAVRREENEHRKTAASFKARRRTEKSRRKSRYLKSLHARAKNKEAREHRHV